MSRQYLETDNHHKTIFIFQIQFFDMDGNLIPYDGQNINISGHDGEEGELGNLANGKTKVYIGVQLSLDFFIYVDARLGSIPDAFLSIYGFNDGVSNVE